jgi:hypothetical protein
LNEILAPDEFKLSHDTAPASSTAAPAAAAATPAAAASPAPAPESVALTDAPGDASALSDSLAHEDSLEESFSSAEFAIGLAAEAQAEEALGEGSGELVGSGEFR